MQLLQCVTDFSYLVSRKKQMFQENAIFNKLYAFQRTLH